MRTPDNPDTPPDTTLDARRQRRARDRADEPEQLSFDDDWIDYWRTITDTWAPLDRDQISAIAAIVEQIDARRAAADIGDPPHQRPEAA